MVIVNWIELLLKCSVQYCEILTGLPFFSDTQLQIKFNYEYIFMFGYNFFSCFFQISKYTILEAA